MNWLSRMVRGFATSPEYVATHAAFAVQSGARRKRTRRMSVVYGVAVHQTGRGVLDRAAKRGVSPIEEALRIYRRTAGPHYVIDYDGVPYQIQADNLRGAHIGIGVVDWWRKLRERRRYLGGKWEADMARAGREQVIKLWRRRWEGRASPQHLYPTKSPNDCYIGIELVPLAASDVGEGDLWFTHLQHTSLGLLLRDIARRHSLPRRWNRTARLVGHEDVDAYERWGSRGGWDPGALRDQPRLDWERVHRGVERLRS